MKNCHPNTLICNEQGFASICRCCDTLHIGFGNFLLAMNEPALEIFLKNMRVNYIRRQADGECPKLKNIVIPTPSREVSLLFCHHELGRFIGFLEAVKGKLFIKNLAREAASCNNRSLLN